MRRALIIISTLYAAPVIAPDGRVWFTVQQGFGRFLDAVGRESSPMSATPSTIGPPSRADPVNVELLAADGESNCRR